MVKITECPRDAMQGIKDFIPTDIKATYINLLLRVGFSRIDFGSFVSHKAMPQMSDTADLVGKLDLSNTNSSLLAIIANLRGAKDAVDFDEISVLGFPFSVSETFQLKNTNSTITESLLRVEEISELCHQKSKIPLVYLSMGFGNPYGDEWDVEVILNYTNQLVSLGIKEFVLADTVGIASVEKINDLYPHLKTEFPQCNWGIHLHSTPDTAYEKAKAAIAVGCDQIDSALRGFGGCPMASDDLTGNLATETLLTALEATKTSHDVIDMNAWKEALNYSNKVFAN
ncbi:hydroxymethylglutaryl-CoA lyase [Albibacterium profundi]|uniref:Hydroxymethylglutaryl-CoA lyase n=1 Tax=Albibacterium profundi TaxID=3134906 RepID=A0ABV5CAD0_9SPHI